LLAPATDCTIRVLGSKTTDDTATVLLTYLAKPAGGPPPLYTFSPEFTNLKSAQFERSDSVVQNQIIYAGIDDVVYDVFKTC
jgi:hypothetical protein